MIKFKLRRIGRKHVPSYRVVVTESTRSPTSKYIDDIGFYNSLTGEFKIDGEKAKSWLAKGVQPSKTVYHLFFKQGIVKDAPRQKTKVVKKEEKNS